MNGWLSRLVLGTPLKLMPAPDSIRAPSNMPPSTASEEKTGADRQFSPKFGRLFSGAAAIMATAKYGGFHHSIM
jgi:hypothetical protein